MYNRATARKGTMTDKNDNNVVRLSLFTRPLASGKAPENFTVYSYLTFKNIVIGLGAAVLLIFLASAVSVRAAFLAASLLALLAFLFAEMAARRKWEKDIQAQLQRMGGDYDRLVRDVARNRNDTAFLRKRLSDAASAVARSYDKAPGEPVEQRMIRGLIDQLAKLDELPQEYQAETEIVPEKDLGLAAGEPGDAEHLTEAQVMQLVTAAARQDRIDLFLQPIVGLPQRKVRFYEMLSRIRIKPGTYLPASRYVGIAHKQDLLPAIDNLLLLRGLQIIRTTEAGDFNHAFFLNITSLTLNDPKFMGDLVEFIAQNRTLAPKLIFELAQADIATMSADALPVLEGLAKLGCRFSMDQVRSLAFDFEQMSQRHIRFVKIDAPRLMGELKEESGLRRLKRLKGEFDRNGIDLIVEKIETDRQLLEILEIDVDYGQGYLFGKPVLHEKT
jgi:cyclic-di-GMP phosphodiesterase TipF (flagellum assembly factor)